MTATATSSTRTPTTAPTAADVDEEDEELDWNASAAGVAEGYGVDGEMSSLAVVVESSVVVDSSEVDVGIVEVVEEVVGLCKGGWLGEEVAGAEGVVTGNSVVITNKTII